MPLRDLATALAPPFVTTGLMTAATFALHPASERLTPLGALCALAFVGATTYIALALIGMRMRLWHDNGERLWRALFSNAPNT